MVSTWTKVKHFMPGVGRLAGKIGAQIQTLSRKISPFFKPHKFEVERRLLRNRKSETGFHRVPKTRSFAGYVKPDGGSVLADAPLSMSMVFDGSLRTGVRVPAGPYFFEGVYEG